ncbi:MAG: Arm DNA-binding domain-containing protein [Photobacterium frigidiphilum]|uniref:Arm DNA-binding domain-containing protein n=1 Tax=Photobacterium frigidiphilum TaxID=264736 RepID=UPI003001227E
MILRFSAFMIVLSYYLYYRLDGKQVNRKIGSACDLTSAQARDLAKEKMGGVAKGNDVHAVKKQEKKHFVVNT